MDVCGCRDYDVAVFGGKKKIISASAFNLYIIDIIDFLVLLNVGLYTRETYTSFRLVRIRFTCFTSTLICLSYNRLGLMDNISQTHCDNQKRE